MPPKIIAKFIMMYARRCYARSRQTRRRIDAATRERCGFLRSRRRTLRDLCPFYRHSDSGVHNSPVSLFDLESAAMKLRRSHFSSQFYKLKLPIQGGPTKMSLTYLWLSW